MKPKQFKRIRLTAQMTQKELGYYLGKSPETISRYENGAKLIPRDLELVMKYIRIYGIKFQQRNIFQCMARGCEGCVVCKRDDDETV